MWGRLRGHNDKGEEVTATAVFHNTDHLGRVSSLAYDLLIAGMEKGNQASSSVMKIGQYWWDEHGRQSIVAVQRTMGHYIDSFAYYSPMAIRHDNEAYHFVARCPLCSKVKLSDTLKRNGFEGKCYGIAPTSLIPTLLTNAHYVCPEDLQQAHDEVHRKLRARQEREQEEHKRQKAQEDEARFKKLEAPFFGITFTDGTIQVRVLESVQEYIEEGQALHHCIFTNEYHLKEKTLILSASIDDKPIETIELSLETFSAEA